MTTVRVDVLRYYDISDITSFAGLLGLVDRLRKDIPAEYHASAVVDIESEYESSYVQMNLWYDRPQTQEEADAEAAKIAKEVESRRIQAERNAEAKERRDREEYARLKAKFEGHK